MAWAVHTTTNTYNVFYTSGSWNGTAWVWGSGSSAAQLSGTNQNPSPSLIQLHNGTLMIFFAYNTTTTSKHFQLFYIASNGGTWSRQFTQIQVSSPRLFNDKLPSAAVGKDGTVWLVWTRDNATSGNSSVMRQLRYMTLKGNVWSTDQNITNPNDLNWNVSPSVVAGKDGVTRLAYSSGINPNFQIKYATFNGVSWNTSYPPITTQTTTDDNTPSIMQDRNGTFWVFWSRDIQGTPNFFQIYGRSNPANGVTGSWTPESALTLNNCPICSDSEYPTAVQSTVDKNIWVFYSYNPGSTFELWGLKTSSPVSPVHDVVMSMQQITTPAVPCATFVGQTCFYRGGFNNTQIPFYQPLLIPLSLTVQDVGDFSENVTVTLSAVNTTSTSLGSQLVRLSAGGSSVVTFNFNTSSVKAARYKFSGNATVPIVTVGNKPDGQVSLQDPIHMLPLGDVDQDGAVTVIDLSIVLFDYGFTCYTPATCSPRYIACEWGDVHGLGIIDILDVGVVLYNYGTVT